MVAALARPTPRLFLMTSTHERMMTTQAMMMMMVPVTNEVVTIMVKVLGRTESFLFFWFFGWQLGGSEYNSRNRWMSQE